MRLTRLPTNFSVLGFSIFSFIFFTEPETSQERKNESSAKSIEDTKPGIMWVSYFNMMSGGVNENTLPLNVHVTRGPNMDLGFDDAVQEVRTTVFCKSDWYTLVGVIDGKPGSI